MHKFKAQEKKTNFETINQKPCSQSHHNVHNGTGVIMRCLATGLTGSRFLVSICWFDMCATCKNQNDLQNCKGVASYEGGERILSLLLTCIAHKN